MFFFFFFFSSRRRHTRFDCDWSSDVCSSDLQQRQQRAQDQQEKMPLERDQDPGIMARRPLQSMPGISRRCICRCEPDRKSTRLNSSHSQISYAVFCLKKKKKKTTQNNTIKHT